MNSTNALAYNRLVYNRLVYNRLAETSLSAYAASELASTAEGREFLLYATRCGLREGNAFKVEHDGVFYTFEGLFGLAPDWLSRGLEDDESRWVSACLIAHINAYGVSVLVSMRAPKLVETSENEIRDFPVYEATFFGDVMSGDTLRTYACLGSDDETALALSPDRALRVCADGTDCAVTSLGYCRDVCEERTENEGWTKCWAGGTRYDQTVSTYLTAYDSMCISSMRKDHLSYACLSSGQLDSCDSEQCNVEWSSSDYYAGRSRNLQLTVEQGAHGALDCYDGKDCSATCEGNGTYCEMDCYGAKDCSMACLDGAECLLSCKNARDCELATCEGELRVCGDTIVCNRECPVATE